jgi:hypothetical protein
MNVAYPRENAMSLQALLIRHGAYAFEKQKFLGLLLGKKGPDWFYDMDKGTLTFGKLFSFQMQLIGSEANRSNTWMWAWANRLSGMPPRLLKASKQVRDYGKRHRIKPLTEPAMKMDEQHQGHNFAMITSGIAAAKAYYRCPHETGTLFVLITDKNYPVDTRHPLQRIALIFPEFIQPYAYLDPAAALQAYCEAHQLTVTKEGQTLLAQHHDGTQLTATFDKHNRLSAIETTLQSSS